MMTTSTATNLEQTTRLFRAVADPTRLRLLLLLRQGERCVCELVDAVEMSQPKVSRHLGQLRQAGLVRGRKQGLWVYYRLAPPLTPVHRRLLRCLQAVELE